MRRNAARRLSALTTSLLLTVGLLAPTAASAAPPSGSAAVFGERGSMFADGPSATTSSNHPIVVRDLSDACPSGRVPKAGFRDVTSSYTFAAAIDCLVWYGITQGKTATTYAPNESVTRRQMAVFIHRMLDDLIVLPDPPTRSRFSDVPATGEVGEAINTLASDELAEMLGVRIVSGKTATTFAPGDRVTRAQMGSFIARTLEGVFHATGVVITDRGNCRNQFSDEARIPPAHLDNVLLLCAAGVVTGRTDGSYAPASDVNRGQMSAFLMRLMDIFVDDEVGITVPPDRFAEVHVDRGGTAAACSDAGRDGSSGQPFCTIQAGIDRARTMDGYLVELLVQPRDYEYEEDVHLRSGAAFAVNLLSAGFPTHLGEDTVDDIVFIEGTLRITGTSLRDYNAVYGVWVDGWPGTGLTVETPGTAEIITSILLGRSAIELDQTGRTIVDSSWVFGDDLSLDITRTSLARDGRGTDIRNSALIRPNGGDRVFLRAPAGASGVDAILNAWRSDNDFVDTAFEPVTTKLETIDGRRVIVAA